MDVRRQSQLWATSRGGCGSYVEVEVVSGAVMRRSRAGAREGTVEEVGILAQQKQRRCEGQDVEPRHA